MELTFKPFCHQISAVKFISEPQDTQALFTVGTFSEPSNSLSLMIYGGNYNEPTVLSKIDHQSDVMDIQYNKMHERILTTSSNGSINIFNVNSDMKLDLDVGWDKVCSRSINGALFCNERIIAVSEDCSILGIRLDKNVNDVNEIFDFQIKDCASVNAVEQIDYNTFVTVNGFGQIKLWDIRDKTNNPKWSNLRYGELATIHCLARHPGQPNIIASGSTGCVCLWDLRNENKSGPVQLNTGLDGSEVWKVRFHPTNPQHLFVAASCGGLISISGRNTGFDWGDFNNSLASLQMNSLVGSSAVNMMSLDVSESLIVAGSDKEMLCFVPIENLSI